MSRITYNIAAKCDKAGRAQNQDNFWVSPNLERIGDISSIEDDKDIELSSRGALMVVADGMGGMKSGEKASEFVIESIKEQFSKIPDDILNDDDEIVAFIKNAIIAADQKIKVYAKDHRESEGMGSTIVLVWLLGEKAYCGWCGDSRIYCYNPQNSLVRLSHDHSYVQSLVDDGKISEEDAFDHPDGNIITRSLGDSGEKANPETKIYPIHRRDVFLLCSDGLCGLLTDSKIETILADNCTSSKDALSALWQEGDKEGWSDNTTIEVACITDGGITPTRKAAGYNEGKPKPTPMTNRKEEKVQKDTNVLPNFWQNNKQYVLIIAFAALVAIGIIWYFSRDKKSNGSSNQEFNVEQPINNPEQNQPEDEQETHNGHNNTPPPVMPNKPTKPDKPITPTKPNQGQQPNNPVVPSQPQQPEQPQTVSQEYLDMLRATYGSIETIEQFIINAQQRRHFTSAEANALNDFKANTADLNAQRKGKIMRPEQEKVLQEINVIAGKASRALKQFKAYDEPQMVNPQPQRVNPNNPVRRGNPEKLDNPTENPIYQNV